MMGRVVIRQRSPVQFSSSCRGVEQSTLPHLDLRTSSCGELNRLIAGIAVEATKFELVINHQDRQDPGALPPCRTMLFARPHEVIE